jgi:hypothetical protein
MRSATSRALRHFFFGSNESGTWNTGARLLLCAFFAVLLLVALPTTAFATAGDLYAAGTSYGASTYSGHGNLFGGPEEWTVDINAVGGDMGRALYAPEAGTVRVFSTGWGSGWGNSVIWTSLDGREQIHMAHLNDIVKAGPVQGGDLIGHAGNTGSSTSDHLHVSRAYDGAPAPLVLSGRTVKPGWSGNGTQWVSAGQVRATIDIAGLIDGMTYYAPVTIGFSAAGVDPSEVSATLDGAPITSGASVSAVGSHTLVVSAAGTAARTVRFQIAAPPRDGLAPVFRFYNPSVGAHFYTASEPERDMVLLRWSSTYSYEGVAYWVNQTTNRSALYRFYNMRTGSHFYTASTQERDKVIAEWSATYSYDGESYRVESQASDGALAVYRFYNVQNGSHFYTASEQERDTVVARWSNTYQYEGPAFWVAQ